METESIKVISDQEIMINGEMINVHDIESVVWDGFGNLTGIHVEKEGNPNTVIDYSRKDLGEWNKNIIEPKEPEKCWSVMAYLEDLFLEAYQNNKRGVMINKKTLEKLAETIVECEISLGGNAEELKKEKELYINPPEGESPFFGNIEIVVSNVEGYKFLDSQENNKEVKK